MRQGKYTSDVCLLLPNVPQLLTNTLLSTSPITLFRIYNVMVLSQSPSQYHNHFNSKFLCNVCNPIQYRRSSMSFTLSSFGQFQSAAVQFRPKPNVKWGVETVTETALQVSFGAETATETEFWWVSNSDLTLNFSCFTKRVRSCSRIMFYKMLLDR